MRRTQRRHRQGHCPVGGAHNAQDYNSKLDFAPRVTPLFRCLVDGADAAKGGRVEVAVDVGDSDGFEGRLPPRNLAPGRSSLQVRGRVPWQCGGLGDG